MCQSTFHSTDTQYCSREPNTAESFAQYRVNIGHRAPSTDASGSSCTNKLSTRVKVIRPLGRNKVKECNGILAICYFNMSSSIR